MSGIQSWRAKSGEDGIELKQCAGGIEPAREIGIGGGDEHDITRAAEAGDSARLAGGGDDARRRPPGREYGRDLTWRPRTSGQRHDGDKARQRQRECGRVRARG